MYTFNLQNMLNRQSSYFMKPGLVSETLNQQLYTNVPVSFPLDILKRNFKKNTKVIPWQLSIRCMFFGGGTGGLTILSGGKNQQHALFSFIFLFWMESVIIAKCCIWIKCHVQGNCLCQRMSRT